MTTLSLLLLSTVGSSLAMGESMIAYKPDIVGVDRMFLVALNVPVKTPEIRVTSPDCVELFDRSRLPARTTLRKYYFRSLRPAKSADILFGHPDGEITVTIEIWSFEDLCAFRKLKDTQLPRRWPLGEILPELKQTQTITSEAQRKAAKDIKRPQGKLWLSYTDDLIWSLQPDSTIPRWHWVNIQKGCPVHGKEVYRSGAFYPWQDEKGRPLRTYGSAVLPYAWKLKCPIDGALYPSNNFADGDMTSGDLPDDGFGGACDYQGDKYGFIAEVCQSYCHKMLAVAPQCADAYLATGDIRYVHKALVAFSRLAVEWSYLATMTQHRHRNSRQQVDRLGPAPFSEGPSLIGSGFTVYCIDQPGYQWRHAEAYDQIFPAIEEDKEIIPYLQSKGFDIQSHEDLRRFIEQNLFAVWMQGAMDLATRSNEPYHQRGLARMAEALNYKRGDEFMDWLYDDEGKMRFFVTNGFFRDGSPYESSGGYNGMHLTALGPIVESIEHLRELRPDVYPDDRYPNLTKSRRYHHVFDFSMNTVNIDRTYPRVGDDGSRPVYRKQPKRSWQNGGTEAFEHAYKIFKDPKFAWALINTRGWIPSLDFPYTREEIKTEAAKWPNDWNDKSCLQDGYGLAMLRSGKGTNKRSLWMMYGRARGHLHDDIMHIGFDAFQSEILGHLGYPRNWNHWTKNWMTQIQARQIPFENMTASAQLFDDAGPVHVAEALAYGMQDHVMTGKGYAIEKDYFQRRMLAIIDVSPDEFYCIDFYRLSGGHEHWWTFHAQEGEFTTEGLDLKKQKGGTLAGPDVPYGDEAWLKSAGCTSGVYGYSGNMFAFPHLYNVERAKPKGAWHADWALKDADGLHFRLTVPSAEGVETVLCDGKSPAGASPYEMKWLLMHKEAESPARTQIASVMELYKEQPVIKSVRPLEVTGIDETGFKPYGLVVELHNGRIDTIFASADSAVKRAAEGGYKFAGRFGLHSEKDGKTVNVALVGGTELTRNGRGITLDHAEYRALITKVDREQESITVAEPPPNIEAIVGKTIFITNPVRRIAYKVLDARTVDGETELRLEFDSRIGTGKVTGHGDHQLETSTPFALRGFRYYHGARLVNAGGTAEYRLNGIHGKVFIDGTQHPEAKADKLKKEFELDTWFEVYDYGVGDELIWPQSAAITRSNK
ncbi:MAG: hypothetical protein O3B01_18510 [Planctomycetota bacterium]|nr:hypothetical protein [Planctomycetota bacterium]